MKRKSYAKINLALNVKNKEKPKDLHELDMINVTVSLCDLISLKILNDHQNNITITCNNPNVPTDENNLVYKVIKQYKKIFKKDFSCLVNIDKRIPLEAGLGGGSSNAAKVLDMLDEHFDSQMNEKQKMSFLEKISSDSSYFVVSPYIARVKGTGNFVTPLNLSLKYNVALVKPKSGCSTKDIYNSLDYKQIVHPNINKIIEAIENNDILTLKKHCQNSLQDSAIKQNDEIKDILNRLECAGFDVVLMTGSGSTCFAFSNKKFPYKHFKEIFNKNNYELCEIYKFKNGVKI